MSASLPEHPTADEDLLVAIHRQVTAIGQDTAVIKTKLEVTADDVAKQKGTIYGNGQPGLVARVASLESGRTDTLTVKSLVIVLGAIGTLAASLGAAIASAVR